MQNIVHMQKWHEFSNDRMLFWASKFEKKKSLKSKRIFDSQLVSSKT